MRLRQQYFGATAALVSARRTPVQVSNAKRNARFRVRLSGTLTTVDGTGTVDAVAGGATLRNAVLLDINNNGDDLFQQISAAFYGHLSEFDAQQPLASGRLPAGTVADGAYELFEEFTVEFSRPRQAIPRETAFVESQMSSPLLVEGQLLQNAEAKLVTITGDATAVLSDVTLEVEQEYSDLEGNKRPLFRPELVTSTFPLPALSTNVRMELRLPARTSDLVIACLDASNNVIAGETGLASLALRGSGPNQDIIGPTPTPFSLLLQKQRELASGDVDVVPGIVQQCFQPHGELSDVLNPNDFTNLALYANGGSAGGTVMVIARVLQRPRPLRPDALVVVPDDQLPPWAMG
jgi:hypothetical protein